MTENNEERMKKLEKKKLKKEKSKTSLEKGEQPPEKRKHKKKRTNVEKDNRLATAVKEAKNGEKGKKEKRTKEKGMEKERITCEIKASIKTKKTKKTKKTEKEKSNKTQKRQKEALSSEEQPETKRVKKEKVSEKSKTLTEKEDSNNCLPNLSSIDKAIEEKEEQSNRVFLGNCSYSIDDEQVREAFKECGQIEDIFWLCDKDTNRFYGTGFITFSTPHGANEATKLNGMMIAGRPTKIEITTPRRVSNTPQQPGSGRNCMPETPKLPGCCTLFMGNLSYEINDELVHDFFKDAGTIVSIRWLTNKETGEFKGCGFVEFADTKMVDRAVLLAGTPLLNRLIRLDYAT